MKWVLLAFTAPWALITWFIGILSLVFFVAHKPRFEQNGILTVQYRPWVPNKAGYRYSTTLGRLILYNLGHRETEAELDERIERHETVHVRQVEDLMLLSFIVGLVVAIGHWAKGDVGGGSLWWLAIWTSGGLWQIPNFLTAILRYGWVGVYRDSEHERSAYGQTDDWPGGSSWWEERDKRRAEQEKAF